MTTSAFIYLQAAPAQGSPNIMTGLLPLILVFVVFYFFMIRPQMRKQKELTNYRNAIAKGDRIITTGGIYGKVVEVAANIVTVEIANDVKIRVDKNAILKDQSDAAARQ
ncbi:MAG: preprotein translocase subunit YajC [Bacteroidales bacterium]|jgi:preprotein translocase subunit YajC|nr:preprotein translocase subunit YajC [Bacteroidales bacterium]HPK85880.1 preprotein translocase subunit YajC [Bacteroidales bacterium]